LNPGIREKSVFLGSYRFHRGFVVVVLVVGNSDNSTKKRKKKALAS